MEIYAFWLCSLVVIPLTLQALAGPIVLKQYGLRGAVPVAALLWLAPMETPPAELNPQFPLTLDLRRPPGPSRLA